jgi:hypothetical protein
MVWRSLPVIGSREFGVQLRDGSARPRGFPQPAWWESADGGRKGRN